jgi:hypothetical protein
VSGRSTELARRRQALVLRSTRQRDDLRHHVADLGAGIALVDSAVRLARGLLRNGPALAVLAGVVVLAGPRRIGGIASKAVRLAPYALQAFAVARRLRSSPPRPT